MSHIVVAALYHFTPLEDLARHQETLQSVMAAHEVKGTILLAPEGVNGTIAGDREGIDAVLAAVRALPGCAGLEHKESHAESQPFLRAKVRLKKEIVTMGVPGISPIKQVGSYVAPEDWNEVISDPDTVVIDTRNDYEVGIGTFEGAINPQTESFRDFPAWYDKFRAENPGKRVAMFCTGGIRCEKSTAYALSKGDNDVVHLKGGILKYLEHVPEADSKWQGECFVFDGRVSVGHGLELGTYDQCFACRRPIDDEMKADPAYVEGVSCPQCIEEYDEEKRKGFAERQKQIALSRARGEAHLGTPSDKS
ncbi:oxygen-dependent tRNA uridine(34) hydroxylase TrhO [Parvularcula marina]|uniref:tRNA uridine(34) hydroxylase n=1 Tax=Parvularcula marina TaxID=2292771 RepID=A0A371RIX9_9PROT|nr:rhodanese-related sulfurtransferase [Parvularcula marina]RFB05384.1 rhodanese-related sulfurtransferase [Parvularcula marina]